jgi:16S rRNA (guanine(966)-N(2))-methyltransferase RsmD
MRVIAGSARGARLAAPRGTKTRPTADRVKEALFSILNSRCKLEGARVLDICAGTGSLGIEALSRGAASCCFIENDRSVMTILEKNLELTGFVVKAECLNLGAFEGLKLLSRKTGQFDVVFFDPPYSSDLYSIIPDELSSLPLLSDGAIFIAECSSRIPLPDCFGRLVKFGRRTYGDSSLEFFAREFS